MTAEREAIASQQSSAATRANETPVLSRLGMNVRESLASQGDPQQGKPSSRDGSDPSMQRGGMSGGRGSAIGTRTDAVWRPKNKDGLTRGAISGMRHGDSFQGGVVNGRTSMDSSNFGGTGSGRAMSGTPFAPGTSTVTATDSTGSRASFSGDATAADAEKSGGLVTEGMSRTESVAILTAERDNQMIGTAEGPNDAFAGLANMSASDRRSALSLAQERQQLGWRPRDDVEDRTGADIPLDRAEAIRQANAIASRKGAAGGSRDGRGDRADQGAGGPMMRRADDGKGQIVTESGGGALSLDAALHLNPLVNPGAQ